MPRLTKPLASLGASLVASVNCSRASPTSPVAAKIPPTVLRIVGSFGFLAMTCLPSSMTLSRSPFRSRLSNISASRCRPANPSSGMPCSTSIARSISPAARYEFATSRSVCGSDPPPDFAAAAR